METPRARPLHPINLAALEYWEAKRGARSMPARRDIAPDEIVRLLPHIVLLDVAYDPLDFRHRLIGTHVDYHLSEPRTGQWMSNNAHQARGSLIWAVLETVVTEHRAVSSSVPYVGPHKEFKQVQDVVMPLSDDDRRVNMVLVSVAFIRKES